MNLYIYVNNDPINRIDPRGLGWWDKLWDLLNFCDDAVDRKKAIDKMLGEGGRYEDLEILEDFVNNEINLEEAQRRHEESKEQEREGWRDLMCTMPGMFLICD